MRKGFSLLTAIIIILLIATLSTLALSLSAFSTKQSSDLYLREQAELLLQSANEYALLALSAHEINATNGCINFINASFPDNTTPMFDINMSIHYIGMNLPSSCQRFSSNDISTIDSNITVIIDTIVQDHNVSTEPIRLHRRTIQKP